MSLLVNNTLANPQASFYAALGSGGGGGSTSNLTSPALVLAGTDGNSELGLIATAGANTASLTIDANGGTSEILMNAGASPAAGYEIKTDNFTGNLVIGGLVAAAPLATFNATSHTVALGDGAGSSQVSATAATVLLDASLVGTVPAGGVVLLNSSSASMKAASVVMDATINGTVATAGVVTLSNTGAAITTGANPGIVVNAAQTLIRGNYHYVVSLGAVSSGVAYPITSPTQTGLYSITVGGAAGDATGIQSQVCCLAYYLGGSGFVSGGCSTALVQSGVNEYAKLFTSNGSSGPIINFEYTALSPASISGLSARVVQLTGDLGF
jgi:hypothetical protein